MKFMLDMWYDDQPLDTTTQTADCFFSDLDCCYRGNIYNANGQPIGDYTSTDSVTIEKVLNIKFK